MKIQPRNSRLWLLTGLFLCYWAVRLFAISAFPPFLDEGIHVSFGRDIMTMGPLAHSNEGRQFIMWFYILFGAQANEPFFISRIANLFVLLPGFAAVIGSARLLSNQWGAFLAALLFIVSPYHHFFERLALGDPPAAAAVTLSIYFTARLRRRVAYRDAVLCGIALFIACGIKLSILPYFAVPVLGMIAFQRNRRGIQWATVALLSACLLTGLYFGVVIWRGYNPLALLETTATLSRFQIALNNAAHIPNMLVSYFGIPAASLLLAMLLLIVQRRLFLPLCLLLPMIALLLSPRQVSRHLIPPVTLLLLCGAVTLGNLLEQRRRLRAPVFALAAVWAFMLWLPFAWTAALSPFNLALSADDHREYIDSEASGFGLAELVSVLNERQPTRVIGVLANCVSLRELAAFPVECPRLNPNGEDVPVLSQLLATSRAPNTYAVLEDLIYAPANAPGTPIAVIDVRHPRFTVYNLAP